MSSYAHWQRGNHGVDTNDDQANAAISTGQLSAFRYTRVHFRPITSWSSRAVIGTIHLWVGFTLRCFQRLSRPYVATRHCSEWNNRYTSGTSNIILSY
jgi:hypothetical protein